MKRQRLDAYLAHSGFGSRADVKKMIKRGLVTVNGLVCKNPKQSVSDEDIRLDGQLCELPPERVDAIIYKPVGYACSHDPREEPLVDELLPGEWAGAGVQMAGRLDRMTSGLLVLSTDGQRIHQLIHPKKKIPKRYQISYSGTLHKKAVQKCAAGLVLEGEEQPCLPAELEIHDDRHATMIIYEGKYHQVRRMIAALGGEVTELHRDKIGDLELPPEMRPAEIALIDEGTWSVLLESGG